ncbi:ATP-binding cassette domain-containing protein [Rhodobacteraceae bacterium F11138]|nr:ATP-binding cassette domain-containing protein [Rhodobacteraceae bacterium F11138]
MSVLSLKNVSHAYLGRTILDGIDLDVACGEIVALVGPSGCGKSTLAHIAAGLTEPKSGRITRTYKRHAMVFQDPALMPWATAAGNIDYGLRLAGMGRAARQEYVMAAAAQVALVPDDMEKFPIELSGGMRQRVAIARALAVKPEFIFFDEPFTALDVALRRRMQNLVMDICIDGRLSGLFITHDLYEAARVAHRIAVLDTRGNGVLGMRTMAGTPAQRSDAAIFDWVQTALEQDTAFRHIHDVDERQLA